MNKFIEERDSMKYLGLPLSDFFDESYFITWDEIRDLNDLVIFDGAIIYSIYDTVGKLLYINAKFTILPENELLIEAEKLDYELEKVTFKIDKDKFCETYVGVRLSSPILGLLNYRRSINMRIQII